MTPENEGAHRYKPFASFWKYCGRWFWLNFDFQKTTFFAKNPTPATNEGKNHKTSPLSSPYQPRCCHQSPYEESRKYIESRFTKGKEGRGTLGAKGEVCEHHFFPGLFFFFFLLPLPLLFGLICHHNVPPPTQGIFERDLFKGDEWGKPNKK